MNVQEEEVKLPFWFQQRNDAIYKDQETELRGVGSVFTPNLQVEALTPRGAVFGGAAWGGDWVRGGLAGGPRDGIRSFSRRGRDPRSLSLHPVRTRREGSPL